MSCPVHLPWRRPAPIVAALPCGPSHIHARSGRVSSFGDAEVNSDLSSIQFDPIQSLPSFTGVVNRLEVDEGKTSAATTVPVQHNLTLLEGAKLAELLLQLALGGVETEAEHTKALRLVRVLPIAIMAPAVGHWRTGVVSSSTLKNQNYLCPATNHSTPYRVHIGQSVRTFNTERAIFGNLTRRSLEADLEQLLGDLDLRSGDLSTNAVSTTLLISSLTLS